MRCVCSQIVPPFLLPMLVGLLEIVIINALIQSTLHANIRHAEKLCWFWQLRFCRFWLTYAIKIAIACGSLCTHLENNWLETCSKLDDVSHDVDTAVNIDDLDGMGTVGCSVVSSGSLDSPSTKLMPQIMCVTPLTSVTVSLLCRLAPNMPA